MNIKAEIIRLFHELPEGERPALLQELSQGKPGITVTEFAQFVQRQYRESIRFTVKVEGDLVHATVHTPQGDFEGVGKNQKVAKERAVQKAFDKIK